MRFFLFRKRFVLLFVSSRPAKHCLLAISLADEWGGLLDKKGYSRQECETERSMILRNGPFF